MQAKSIITKQEEVDGVQVYHLQRIVSFKECYDNIRTTFIDPSHYDMVIDHDADGYDSATGELLFRFRKKAMPMDVLMSGVENYSKSIGVSNQRGDSAGGSYKREGTNQTVSPDVRSGRRVYGSRC